MSSKQTAWLALAVIPLLFIAIACGGKKKSDAAATPQPGAQVTATRPAGAQATATRPAGAQTGSGDKDFDAFMETYSKVKSFRAKMAIESPGQPKIEMTFESVSPDRLHMSISSGIGIAFELITIGNDSYQKIGTAWQRAPAGSGGLPFSPQDIANLTRDLSQQSDVKRGGTETVEGTRCQIFTATQKSTNSVSEFCVSSDNLPRRVVTQQAATKITLIFSDYNANIDIKAPI